MNDVRLIILKKILSAVAVCLGCVLWTGELRAETSMNCGSRSVETGDRKRDVEDICGPPSFVEDYEIERVVKIYAGIRPDKEHEEKSGPADDGDDKKPDRKHSGNPEDSRDHEFISERSSVIDVEEWTYNFGPSRFIRTLVFENDRLVAINDGRYGYDKEPDFNRLLDHEDSKAVVWMKYGEPGEQESSTDYRTEVNRERRGDYWIVEEISTPVRRDIWVYDRGPNKFLLELVFKNNRLVSDRTLKTRGRKQAESRDRGLQ